MKKSIKRIIAREGLILIGIVAVGLIALIFGTYSQNQNVIIPAYFLIFFGYIVYRLVSFIIWAIKMLAGK